MKNESVWLSEIDLDNSPKVRAETNEDSVTEYAAAYEAKTVLPAPILYRVPGLKFLLVADGTHRIKAAIKAGKKQLTCEVHEGTLNQCVEHALRSNLTHGLKRTHKDREACAETALKKFPNLSDSALAKMCSVHRDIIAKSRDVLETCNLINQTSERTGLDGRNIGVSAIGSTQVDLPERQVAKIQISEENLSVPLQTNGLRTSNGTASQNGTQKQEITLPIIEDKIGREIPPAALVYWNRQDEVKQFLAEIMVIRKRVAQIIESKDVLWARCMLSDAEAAADRLYSEIQGALAYAVCPTCQGHTIQKPKSTCEFCRGKGLISKLLWDATVDRETKSMAAASVQRRKESAA